MITRPVDESTIAQMFDRIAVRYDFLNRLLSLRQDVRWRKHLVKSIPYRPGGTFLDMATGTGDVAIAVSKKRTEYDCVIGGDISQNMLSLAAEKAALLGEGQESVQKAIPKLTWKKMSAEKILQDDQSIDCVSISFGLRNVVNKENALQEFHRVLKSGGYLLILEFFTPTQGFLSRLFQFYFHSILPRIGRFFSEKEAYTYLPKSVASFYSPEGLQKALLDHGFVPEGEKSFLFGACRLVKAKKPR